MSSLYFCPTVREVESATGGGFDTCCEHPELHVPMPDNEATSAVSQALSDAAKREFQLQQQVARIRAFLEDMAGWCSPHGVAADYARRALDALDGVDPLGLAGPTHEELDEELDGADRYAAMVNAPLRPATIVAIAERIKSGDFPVRKVRIRVRDMGRERVEMVHTAEELETLAVLAGDDTAGSEEAP